ncbi:putative RNA-directed RNA polymerase [Bienertia sinuspersici]
MRKLPLSHSVCCTTEWTEDIIRRCKTTLMKQISLMSHGETSISLWDLRILGGLPIYGAFYDEVVPTALELKGSKDGKHFFPPSCKCMFAALQSIMSTSGRSHVTFQEWCRFWF